MDIILINPKVLKWAREKNNYSIAQAAKKCGVKDSTYSAWEDGIHEVPANKLPKLSQVFKYPSAIFLLDVLPEEKYPIEFRNYFIEYGILQSKELNVAIRSALSVQDKLRDLMDNTSNEFITNITKLKDGTSLTIANGLISTLGIDYEKVLESKDSFKQFKAWKSIIENKGIAVMEMGFPQSEARSFVLYDEISPVIVLNTKDFVQSRMFSLFHELAHLVFSSSTIDNDSTLSDESSGSLEAMCNGISAQILVPNDLLDEQYASHKNEDLNTVIFNLSQYFKVSREVIAYRLKVEKYINGLDIETYIESIKPKEPYKAKKRSGGNYYKNVVINSSPLFLNTVFERFNENKIEFSKVVEYTRVKAEKIPNLEMNLIQYYE